jgi:hypothetical protein
MDKKTTTKNRQARALPPPDYWPDGHRGSVWREDMVCGLRGIVALLPEHQVQLMLTERGCADMQGAIALALDIDPRVKTVVTYSGDRMDTVYMLNDAGQWEFRDARPRAARRIEIEAAITQTLKDNDGRLKRGRLVRLMQAAGFTAAPIYRTLTVMSEDGRVIQAGDVLVLQP